MSWLNTIFMFYTTLPFATVANEENSVSTRPQILKEKIDKYRQDADLRKKVEFYQVPQGFENVDLVKNLEMVDEMRESGVSFEGIFSEEYCAADVGWHTSGRLGSYGSSDFLSQTIDFTCKPILDNVKNHLIESHSEKDCSEERDVIANKAITCFDEVLLFLQNIAPESLTVYGFECAYAILQPLLDEKLIMPEIYRSLLDTEISFLLGKILRSLKPRGNKEIALHTGYVDMLLHIALVSGKQNNAVLENTFSVGAYLACFPDSLTGGQKNTLRDLVKPHTSSGVYGTKLRKSADKLEYMLTPRTFPASWLYGFMDTLVYHDCPIFWQRFSPGNKSKLVLSGVILAISSLYAVRVCTGKSLDFFGSSKARGTEQDPSVTSSPSEDNVAGSESVTVAPTSTH